MRSDVPITGIADLCWQAEHLYDELKRAEQYVEAACVWDALVSLRRKVREEREQ